MPLAGRHVSAKRHCIVMLFSLLGPTCMSASAAATSVDIVVSDARIIDGTGSPWFYGDVAISDGRIVAVGANLNIQSRERINARGRVIAPGFIDVHTHVESNIQEMPEAANFLFDGVTTIITGNCGTSAVNIREWRDELGELGPNVATLVGHNSVRQLVLGRANRDPSLEEMEEMASLVRQAMVDGAVGLSTGLLYVPGTYAHTDEVVRLATVASRFGGVYATHLRDQGAKLHESIDEAVRIGREARIPVQISHLKVKGPARWGTIGKALVLIREYRDSGVDVTVDAYPYDRASTKLGITLPAWALAGSSTDLLARLSNTEQRQKIRAEMKEILADGGYPNYSFATVALNLEDMSQNGKTISEISLNSAGAASIDDEIDVILRIMSESARSGNSNGPQMIYHFMSIADVEEIFRDPNSAVASDGGIRTIGEGTPHPRSYGTNARVLARFVREQNLLTLPDAVRRMTSLPARTFQLQERGIIRPGFIADLVLFDPQAVVDKSTFENPHQYSEGFDYVIVNGVVVIKDGRLTNKRPGKFVSGRQTR